MNNDAGNITELLRNWSQGQPDSFNNLFPLVYAELRKTAKQYLSRENGALTLQPTALIHEVYLRLLGDNNLSFPSRRHFFAFAAKVMRRILVEHARARGRQKRGGNQSPVPIVDTFDHADASERPELVLALDEVLQRLKRVDPRKNAALELFYFGGMTVEEIAEQLSISTATAKRELRAARAWVGHRLSQAKAGTF